MVAAGFFLSVPAAEVWNSCLLYKNNDDKIKVDEGNSKEQKKPCVYVGRIYVTEPYQEQGYMRRVMDIAFAEGNRLGIPVVLDTDAKSKCERDQHLGVELAAEVPFRDFGAMHHLIEYPD